MENVEIDKEKGEQFLKELQENSIKNPIYFILEGKNIVPVTFNDIIKFEKFMVSQDRILKKEKIGNLLISTVFLGINHSWGGEEDHPILFETMVFKKNTSSDLFMQRYSTYEQAEEGHNNIKLKIKKWMRHKGKRATLRKLNPHIDWVKKLRDLV